VSKTLIEDDHRVEERCAVMSICIGCVVAAGSFLSVEGLGRVSAWLAERKRQRAMQEVLDEPSEQEAEPTTSRESLVASRDEETMTAFER
jgi:hypothetical protein